MGPAKAALLKQAATIARERAKKKQRDESIIINTTGTTKEEEEEEDCDYDDDELGDMCGPMRPPTTTMMINQEEEEEEEEEETAAVSAVVVAVAVKEKNAEKKKGRWGDDSSEEEEAEEEEEVPTTTTTTAKNERQQSYLEKMMNEQAEFATFTAQQQQQQQQQQELEEEEEEDIDVSNNNNNNNNNNNSNRRKRQQQQINKPSTATVDVTKFLTPPTDDDDDDVDDYGIRNKRRASIEHEQTPPMSSIGEDLLETHENHKKMDTTTPFAATVEIQEEEEEEEAGPMLPPPSFSLREQIENANKSMVEERREFLNGASTFFKKKNLNEFSESEDDDDDNNNQEYIPLLPKPHDHKKSSRSVECFQKLGHIDEGTYGVVFKARDKETGEIAALKKVKMDKEKEGFPITALREINTLLQLQHKNIVYVSEVVVGRSIDQVFMVMEYCGRDLNRLMDDINRGFTLPECKCLAWQLLSGVSYLHENWVLHRDLKTTNVLFNDLGELKICDFGLAREYGSPLNNYTPLVCTLWYRPPELLLGEKTYSYAVDNWSLGCILAELLQGKPLFPGRTEIDQIDKHFRMLGTPNEVIWPKFKTLPHATKVNFAVHPHNSLRQRFPKYREREDEIETGPGITDAGFNVLNGLLLFDPEKRLTSTEALKSSWFQELPKQNTALQWKELLNRMNKNS
jgi:hypothetical protein